MPPKKKPSARAKVLPAKPAPSKKAAPKSQAEPKSEPKRKAGSSPSPRVRPPALLVAPPASPEPPAPTEPPAYEFLGRLPESYGTRKLFLVPRDPRLLFAYWDLHPVQYQEAARAAKDGKVFLEVYVPGEGRVQQVHVWDMHRNWYLQVDRPDTLFVAQLGFYRPDGGFEVLARSAEVRTPRDTLSPHTEAKFVTIPFNLTFRELWEMIAARSLPGEELADTLARLQESDRPLSFQVRVERETAEKNDGLLEYLDGEEIRRRRIGSFEITEILRKRFETALSSGQWNSSGGVTSLSSPFGASFGRPRGFHMHLNAELIIYGGTAPDARLRIDGQEIALSPDGTFSYHFVFPDGEFHIPVEATSADGAETRSALLSFLRVTSREGDVRQTAQPRLDEPLGRTEG